MTMKKCMITTIALLFGMIVCLWIQYEKLGPMGDDVHVVFTLKTKHENGDKGSSSVSHSLKGKILLIRLSPSGSGMDAKVQTTEGWYEYPLHFVSLDWTQEDPVELSFAYADKVQFRTGLSMSVTDPLYVLGFRIGPGQTIGSGGSVFPGDVGRVALNREENGRTRVTIDATEGTQMNAMDWSFGRIIEISLSP